MSLRFVRHRGESCSTQNELKALRLLATELLSYGPAQLAMAMATGEIVEVSGNG